MQKLIIHMPNLNYYNSIVKISNKLVDSGYDIKQIFSRVLSRGDVVTLKVQDIYDIEICFCGDLIEIEANNMCDFETLSHIRNNVNKTVQELLKEKSVEEGSKKYEECRG